MTEEEQYTKETAGGAATREAAANLYNYAETEKRVMANMTENERKVFTMKAGATAMRIEFPITNKMFIHDSSPDYLELEIRKERRAQDDKWGQQNHDPFIYQNILGEEFGEVSKAILDAYDFKNGRWDTKKLEHYRKELIQVAAVTKAMIEALDHGTWLVK